MGPGPRNWSSSLYGWSGGGPHVLAYAALMVGRCAAAATIAGLGPADVPDLD
jgi:hypothetical protein